MKCGIAHIGLTIAIKINLASFSLEHIFDPVIICWGLQALVRIGWRMPDWEILRFMFSDLEIQFYVSSGGGRWSYFDWFWRVGRWRRKKAC